MQRCGQNKRILTPVSIYDVSIIRGDIIKSFPRYLSLINTEFSGIDITATCYGFSAAFINQVVAYYAAAGSCYIAFRIGIHFMPCATISGWTIRSQSKRDIKVFCISNGAEGTKHKCKDKNTGYNLPFHEKLFSMILIGDNNAVALAWHTSYLSLNHITSHLGRIGYFHCCHISPVPLLFYKHKIHLSTNIFVKIVFTYLYMRDIMYLRLFRL